MPLYDPAHTPHVDPADAAVVVHRFLDRCRAWALERELPKRLERVAEGLDPAEAAKLHGWITWLRFVEHAQGEIVDGTLDDWLREIVGHPRG